MGITQITENKKVWEANRPQGGGNRLFFRAGDIAFAHFIGSGNDDDPYMEVFIAHELPADQPGGYPKLKYCPNLSNHDSAYECEYCDAGLKTKERMNIWFYVYQVLHSVQPETKTGEKIDLPRVDFAGKTYWKRDVNRPLLWEASAWRESPLGDIIFQYGQLGDLRARVMTIRATGNGLERRYKIDPLFDSGPFDPNVLNNLPDDQKPTNVRADLLDDLKPVETVENPNNAPAQPFVFGSQPAAPMPAPIPPAPVPQAVPEPAPQQEHITPRKIAPYQPTNTGAVESPF